MAAGGTSDVQLQRLAQLVTDGDFGQVRLLATRELVRATDGAHRTVLMLVADTPETPVEAEKCLLYLFELGADPKATDEAGDTAAHLAARREHVRVLALLPFDAKWLPNKQGATPLMDAARTGSWKSAKHLLHLLRQNRHTGGYRSSDRNSKRLELLKLKDLEGRTALDLARLGGHPELSSDIEREMRLVVADDWGSISGLTASEAAAREELQRLALAGDSAVLRRAATRASCDLPNYAGDTALMWAAGNSHCGDAALWERLLQLADPTCAGVGAFSCLHRAADGGSSAAASALLAAGANANARADYYIYPDSTPLMWAASDAPPATAAAVGRALLAAGADWSLKDSDGQTALDWATASGRTELAELLRGYKGKVFFDEPPGPPFEDQVFFDEPLELPPVDLPFLERWDSVHLICRGGFGEVHEVLTDKGIRCAAMTLRLPVQSANQLDSVRREIDRAVEGERNLCRLRHVNIVRFLHIAQPEPATVVLFMELLDGDTLETFLDKKPLDEGTIRDFSRQICRALLYMHSRRPPVIHRDINCSNIVVLSDNRRLKLIDFGLSIRLEQSVSHISASAATPKGTLNFMAPELLAPDESDSPPYSRESDIWAFGCSIFQMATGSRPFAEHRNSWTLPERLRSSGAPALPDGSSAELRDFYSRCTARDRKRRKSAADLWGHEFLTGWKLKPGFFSGLLTLFGIRK